MTDSTPVRSAVEITDAGIAAAIRRWRELDSKTPGWQIAEKVGAVAREWSVGREGNAVAELTPFFDLDGQIKVLEAMWVGGYNPNQFGGTD